jgi:D-alanine transaminase
VIAYVNGRYRPLNDATVNIEDRGYQFGDGIYEVLYVHQGHLIDADLHLARLTRSLTEIGLAMPVAPAALPVIVAELLRRNRVSTGLVYLQVTRGVAKRDHPFPPASTRPALVITVRHKPPPPADAASWAVACITLPDQRWARCDIKSINMLPNVLAKQAARQAGAYEAILYDAADNITEGAASTVWIVDETGILRTRQLDHHILPGCTRAALLTMLDEQNIRFEISTFSLTALRTAREIFLTSATSFIKPVTTLDHTQVAAGTPGPITTSLLTRYVTHITTPKP